jgi:ribosome-binding factor A
MEHFFTPTRRLRDQSDGNEPFEYEEVQLSVPVEDFLMQWWDWSVLLAFVTGGEIPKIVWITEGTFLAVEGGSYSFDLGNDFFGYSAMLIAHFAPPSREIKSLFLATHPLSASPLSAGLSSIFWRAVTTSNSVSLHLICNVESGQFGLCSAPSLSIYLGGSPWLQRLRIQGFGFEEAHCCALANLERMDLEIQFVECCLDAQDAEETFIEWLRHGQAVTALFFCRMENSTLSALSGNSSIKMLMIDGDECGWNQIRSLAQLLPGNKGIEYLNLISLTDRLICDKRWSLLFRSMWTHPRIQNVKLKSSGIESSLSAKSKASRMREVLQMLRYNTVVHTIDLSDDLKDEEIYENSIMPRLEMNRSRFEEQRQALKRADPSIRGQLLGRAHVVRYNPDLFFRFLSENVPAFVRSDEDPIILSGKKRKAQA